MKRNSPSCAATPVTRNMDAVKHNRIIILDALALQASIRTFDGLEQLAHAIDGYDLHK
ncbi:putative ABC transporter cobalamin-binding protein [Pseudomonas fluorescens]|uniref:Putative ABC transporter cobalamin-binding protein n=1 Tax=Pseudomonas fluorescens TaxID=294 RepID=A0A8B4IAH5_PSEFL|nr:putative ABC transporter cobalamin-binding protein [Pseudomonas fluorescens]